jgi:multidrug efflux pump subunit AcrA (membrane-fusion protein)
MNPISMYRAEALQHRSAASAGDVLRLAPAWTRWVFWDLLLAVVAALAYLLIGTLHEYATGPAVVWMNTQRPVTATVTGTVSDIEVTPGQAVKKGEVLLRLASLVEQADVERLDHDFEFQLAKLLRDPADVQARALLSQTTTQREVATVRLELLTIRAPEAGVIGDMRIRPGELLEAGHVALSLLTANPDCTVRVMLPAQYKPQLRPGISMRFEMTGYRFAYQEMTVRSVSAQIVGPEEVRRFLGQEIGDTVQLSGPMVLVEATPRSTTFTVDGRGYDFYHGMSGVGEVRVRTENVLISLVPALRALFGGGDVPA